MTNKIKTFFSFFVVAVIAFSLSLSVSAVSVKEKFYEDTAELISVSYRGDTAVYPANTLEGVLSAFSKGADMVSVSVMKTKDGAFVLLENRAIKNILSTTASAVGELTYSELSQLNILDGCNKETIYKVPTLKSVIDQIRNIDAMLVLDLQWQEREELYNFLLSENALSFCVLRADVSAKEVEEFVFGKSPELMVAGIYNSFVVTSAISYIKDMSAISMPFVSYQTKNYFNTMFDGIANKYYRQRGSARAMASTYDVDLCGQRTDGEDGWNELIKKNFTIIETNNIVSLVSYIERSNNLSVALTSLIERAKTYDASVYSLASAEKLEKAILNAEASQSRLESCDEKQQAYSELLNAINTLTLKDGEDTQKGALSVTPGKIIAAILVGSVILAAQVYVHKMQNKKEK